MKMHDSEKLFANYLIADNKTYIFQPSRFKLKNTTYRADFYCPENNTYYEVVGTRQAFCSIKPKLIEFIKTYPDINFKIVKPNGQEYKNREALFEKPKKKIKPKDKIYELIKRWMETRRIAKSKHEKIFNEILYPFIKHLNRNGIYLKKEDCLCDK